MDLSEYTAALRELRPGDAAEVEMGGLTSRALKRRVGQAARQMGYSLKWARETGGSSMRFLVRQDPTADSRAPRRGRPRKTADGVA